MNHQWELIKKALTTSMWECKRCGLKASSNASLTKYDRLNIHKYHYPDSWSKLDIEEARKQYLQLGEPACMTPDDRIIRDIIT